MASPSQPERIYDVFLSFRGPDTRHAIISHIYRDLDRGGIYTFKDDEKLKKGEPVSPTLIKAIEKSRIAVIIFTPDFATSTWCLKEVAKIMDCKETNNLIVLPVFYYVDPKEVRNQRKEYKKAFDEHEKKHREDLKDVKKWKKALDDAGSLYGSEFNVWVVAEETPIHLESREFKNEAELVESIVREIWIQLNPTPLDVAKFPVGLVSRVDELILKFKMKSKEEIRTIGFCSMGGMGKTTLARALYNSVFKDFEGSAYVDVKGTSQEKEKMVHLQEKLLRQMLMIKEISLNSDAEGSSLIKKRLCRKRVLLILDGVDDMGQIYSLAKKHDWFGEGSRIVITTTDKNLLNEIKADIYEVQCLDEPDARKLFMEHASESRDRIIKEDLVDRALQYTQCLPLALEVLGRAFAAREENEWKSKLDDFAASSDHSIDNVLRISYDALDYKEKQIFLHIACFFNGWSRRYVEGVLKNCELSVETGVNDLIRRYLIMDENGTLRVHDLIELMGKNIVVSECPPDVAKRSRLWRLMDVRNVLSRDKGTDAVEAIVLAPPEPENIEIYSEAFQKLENLRFLIMINVQTDFRDPIYLPRELRWFEWPECPASCLKLTYPDNLTVLAVRRRLFREPREP
ncbi:hypothetical protein ACJRO7_032086 [Eucalyptus globulus]|uniref:TIR domain-containing protein n=1 Tax=Eucalyptus globulus TaxID=34317 RepID=A0ABD3JJN0_EUCGL